MLSTTPANVTGSTLSGGAWQASGTGDIGLPTGIAIDTIDADLTLVGEGANIESGAGVDAIAGASQITTDGSLTIAGGRNFTSTSIFTNNGLLSIGVNSTFTVASTNSFSSGLSTVVDGTLVADAVTIANGSLSGSGEVSGPVTVQSGGSIEPGGGIGILETGDVTFSSGAAFGFELLSPYATAGADYDQLKVTGTLDLADADLDFSGGAGIPPVGTILTLINVESSDAVIGTFNNLPEQGTVTFGGFVGVITYRGGDGNDVVITAQATNQPPTISPQSFQVDENQTSVGTVVAFDADLPGDTLTYSIVGGADAAAFSIQPSSGALSFVSGRDFEAPTDLGGTSSDNIYLVEVQVEDGGGEVDRATMTVNVQPVNDNSPSFTSPNAANVPENTTAVQTLAATDADLPGQAIAFSIVGGNDAGAFEIIGNQLQFKSAPDFEAPTDSGSNNVYEVRVAANDGSGLTTTQDVSVSVTPVNDNSPEFTSPNAVTVAENTSDVLTLAADDDDAPSQTVTFSIVGGDDAARFSIVEDDRLQFKSAPDFETPLDEGGDNVYEVQVRASDPGGLTDLQSVSVNVTDGNELPVASPDTGAADENGPAIVLALTANDTDPDTGDDLEIQSINTSGTIGSVVINADDDSITYDPNGQFESLAAGGSATDTLTYVVEDGNGGTAIGTVTITVNGQNDPPSAEDDIVLLNENTSVLIDVLANDGDIDGDTLLIASLGSASNGTVAIETGKIRYAPAADFFGADTFTYTISDGNGGTDTATVNVAVNTVPVATLDSEATEKSSVLSVDASNGVLANDSDRDGDSLIVTTTGTIPTAKGALLTLNADGSYDYDPNGQFDNLGFGGKDLDTFEYTISDSRGGLSTATLKITITSSLIERPDLTVAASDISFSPINPDAGDNVTITAVVRNEGYSAAEAFDVEFLDFGASLGFASVPTLEAGGSTTVSWDATFPETGFRLISVVADPQRSVSETSDDNNEAAQVLQVGTPATPSAVLNVNANPLTAFPGQVVSSTGAGYYDFDTVPGTQDFPVQGGAVTVEILDAGTLEVLSTFAGATTSVTGALRQPILAPAAVGTYFVRITVTDFVASGFDLATLNVIEPLPTDPPPQTPSFVPPLPTDPPPTQPTGGGGGGSGGGGGIEIVTSDPTIGSGASSVPGGSVEVKNNVFVYAEYVGFSDPNPDLGEEIIVFAYIYYTGPNDTPDNPVDAFTVELNDIFPIAGALQKFTMGSTTVSFPGGESSSPKAVSFTYRNTAAGAHIMQIDTSPPDARNTTRLDDDATRLLQVGPASPAIDIDQLATLLVDADANGVVSPGDTLRYTLLATNVSSNEAQGGAVFVEYDEQLAGMPTNIAEGGVAIEGAIQWDLGTINANETITLSYELLVEPSVDEDAVLNATAFFRTEDAPAVFDTSRVPIRVNDAPTATDDAVSTDEDNAIDIDVLSNDNDPDGDQLTISIVSDAGNGAATVVNGVIRYTPDADFNGVDTITYAIDDGNGGVDTANLGVTISPVADIASDTSSTDEDTPVNINVLSNDDFEGSPVVTAVTNGSNGSVAIQPDGTVTYTPAADFNGSDSFTYTVASGGVTETADVQIVVTARPDVRLGGRVFDDVSNDGVFNESDSGLQGIAVELYRESDLTAPLASAVTDATGRYLFDLGLPSGAYRIVAAQPDGLLDGSESTGTLGGDVNNATDSNVISSIVVPLEAGDVIVEGYGFANIRGSRIQGMVWEDANNNGEVDFGELAIKNVSVRLTGTDDRGALVDRVMETDENGIFEFVDLRPSNASGYTLTQTQPADFLDGIDSLGTVNGVASGTNAVDDVFSQIDMSQPGSEAVNYNFGELPSSGEGVQAGQTATIGFWQNRRGQALIRSLNGGPESTQLANWLATNFPNMYGAGAGPNDLTDMTNKEVAQFYKSLFKRTRFTSPGGSPRLDAQALAVALAVYVTDVDLAGTIASQFGFTVDANGVGVATVDVGASGSAFGLPDDSTATVFQLLQATNDRTSGGLLYDLDESGVIDFHERVLRFKANVMFARINWLGARGWRC